MTGEPLTTGSDEPIAWIPATVWSFIRADHRLEEEEVLGILYNPRGAIRFNASPSTIGPTRWTSSSSR